MKRSPDATMPRTALKIVLAGPIAAVPGQGGATWAILQYVLGLRRLGHRVIFVDPVPRSALRPVGATLNESVNAAYFNAVVRRFGLEQTSALLVSDSPCETIGLPYGTVVSAARDADLLINISGVLRDEAVLAQAQHRVYVDLDPAFTQLWHAVQGLDMGFDNHTAFVTIGKAIGMPHCPVPTCGLPWIATWQPIVLERWPIAEGQPRGAITTVANWRGYGSIQHEGRFYGQKVHAWRAFMTLPTRTTERIRVALAIDPGETTDVQALAANGWDLVDPGIAATPEDYQRFVQASKAELGIAKIGYVVSRTGWISDRSICYLASGRPVLAQETGFSHFVPAGEGLLPFETLEQVLDCIARLNSDYARHARAARALAEEYFDSDKVLTQLLDRLAISTGSTTLVPRRSAS
jgi:hypothetical protein